MAVVLLVVVVGVVAVVVMVMVVVVVAVTLTGVYSSANHLVRLVFLLSVSNAQRE